MNAQYNAMTMDEMDQVTGGMYLPGHKGPARPLAFWWVVLAAVGAGAVVGPAILTTIAGKMVVTGAIAALGIAGGAALMGLAIVAAAAFNKRRHDSSQKAKGYVNRDARDFGREEWEKLHSGE